jgi:anti-anti-sigma factor
LFPSPAKALLRAGVPTGNACYTAAHFDHNCEGNTMPTIEPQIWKSARLTIERTKSEKNGTVFRFSGPLTTRDMYSSLSPDAFRNIFESTPGDEPPPIHTFDLKEVPYMDSTGLGMLASLYARCQSKGIRLNITGLSPRVQELFKLTGMQKVLPIGST